VSLCILSGVSPEEKVFAATEVSVMLRNPDVDAASKDRLECYKRCMLTKSSDINVAYISG
jgi:hypothetical protein